MENKGQMLENILKQYVDIYKEAKTIKEKKEIINDSNNRIVGILTSKSITEKEIQQKKIDLIGCLYNSASFFTAYTNDQTTYGYIENTIYNLLKIIEPMKIEKLVVYTIKNEKIWHNGEELDAIVAVTKKMLSEEDKVERTAINQGQPYENIAVGRNKEELEKPKPRTKITTKKTSTWENNEEIQDMYNKLNTTIQRLEKEKEIMKEKEKKEKKSVEDIAQEKNLGKKAEKETELINIYKKHKKEAKTIINRLLKDVSSWDTIKNEYIRNSLKSIQTRIIKSLVDYVDIMKITTTNMIYTIEEAIKLIKYKNSDSTLNTLSLYLNQIKESKKERELRKGEKKRKQADKNTRQK